MPKQQTSETSTPRFMIVTRTVILDSKNRFLLLHRHKKRQYNAGLWELPGGKLEPGDWATSAIEREALEEAGLKVLPLNQLYSVHTKYVTQGKYKDTCYVELVGISKLVGGKTRISQEDHSEAKWVTLNEAFDFDLTYETRGALASLSAEFKRLRIKTDN